MEKEDEAGQGCRRAAELERQKKELEREERERLRERRDMEAEDIRSRKIHDEERSIRRREQIDAKIAREAARQSAYQKANRERINARNRADRKGCY